MQNYHALLSETMNNGIDQLNSRTGHVCRVLVGHQVQFDLRDGFPAVTSKFLAFKSVVGELLGFFRGYDSAADFRSLNCKIWDQNANETKAWLDSPYRKGHDDLGRIYGNQWCDWIDRRVVATKEDEERLLSLGYKLIMADREKGLLLLERRINQLEDALHKIITDPSNRRIIISGWNPAELDQMALPPCHMDYRFVPFEETKVLNVVMTIRSWDLFLGAPFNIAETALFLAIMAKLSGYTPGIVTIQATNAHIYDNHFSQVTEQLSRNHYPLPKLVLSDRIKEVTVDQIAGVFTRIEPSDISLDGYQSHPAIKAAMAA